MGVKASAAAEEACWKDPGVIKNDEIAGAEEVGEFAKISVSEVPAGAYEMKKPGGGAIGKGLLRNQFFWEIVIEIRNKHAG